LKLIQIRNTQYQTGALRRPTLVEHKAMMVLCVTWLASLFTNLMVGVQGCGWARLAMVRLSRPLAQPSAGAGGLPYAWLNFFAPVPLPLPHRSHPTV
jgi:hypothetical protein